MLKPKRKEHEEDLWNKRGFY